METPFYDHLTLSDYDRVYEPSEDTFLLLDAIESDLKFIEYDLKPTICLEIGSGSGIVVTAIAKKIKNCFCLGTDINRFACSTTIRTKTRNNVAYLEAINANLSIGLRENLFDMVLFNPPYVVTTEKECLNEIKNELAYTWAGGIDGRLVIDRFLKSLSGMLAENGVAYLLLLKENKPDEILKDLNQNGFEVVILIERRIIGEHLFVIKIIRN